MLLYFLFGVAFASTYFSVIESVDNTYRVVPGRFKDNCAIGYFDDTKDATGWGQLYLKSNQNLADDKQSYCLGYLEAYLTHHQMYLYWNNYKMNEYNKGIFSDTLKSVMIEQLGFFKAQSLSATNDYWKHQKVILSQFNGLVDAYTEFSPSTEALPEIEIYMLLSVGDLENLNEVYKTGTEPKTSIVYMSKAYPDLVFHECSALVRNVDDEIYFGHATWRGYYAMLRIYKIYDVKYNNRRIRMSFSSSPGLIHSKDDYYTVNTDDNSLFVMETTNSVYDTSLIGSIADKLLSWQRILGSLYYDTDAKTFVETIKQYNSGTYNNQWIVFDANAWKLKKEALFICEQMPGLMKSLDVTDFLTTGDHYWGSFNVPYDTEIYEKSGYSQKYPDVNEYTDNARAKIFKRDAVKVTNMDEMKHIMLYNDYLNDELSLKEPSNAIAARYDLRSTELPPAFGAIDGKIVKVSEPHITHAISGPTHQEQTPFDFKAFPDVVREGVPDLFNFDWVVEDDRK
ncbi:hypothetical protein EIN_181520 [Entamoeba invadens IP1]|uniref:Phospholipase B-like n=1 Tax=Entamoeba invadens TaxID=33085 RepID=S0B2L3_ENTIV|nr:hypothetical protein EIN_181520 [Entamoeba invadens IP1]ELP93985.1 hypothetical protein EIN_181520 [Entamoeba invadens IP1]BAN41449.1 hypothetical protein, conserved [Entamoeba invadens]|eukprot:XP_004260756.1 hypothetical protein EIN_181520 [Entamoeba invadens IP1]